MCDFFGGNDAKAETPVLWPPHAKSWLIGKDSDAGRDWGQEEKGTTEEEMAGWHHWLDGRESQWTPRVGDGQGGLACCDSWGRKESDMTERLNWTELKVNIPCGSVATLLHIFWNPGEKIISCLSYTSLETSSWTYYHFHCHFTVESKVKVDQLCPTLLWPRGLCSPWHSPGQNTWVLSISLFQGIFPIQGSNPGLLHCRFDCRSNPGLLPRWATREPHSKIMPQWGRK